jgi:4-amino-4-deoxy-L-arabinose transferase-like glycosyltransferase
VEPGTQGWANAFYSAAAQAGSQSWKAFLFGSSDAANSITVDKPPMSLWPMALSVRAFGLNPWSILLPQALAGVATVALVWDTVRRRFGEAAGLIAGLVFALTPVAVAIFRHNNPDALLVFFLAAALWAALRAVDDGRTRWWVLCGALIGGGYLTKQLVVVLMLPALFVPYLVAGPPAWTRRVWQVALAVGVAVLAGGWWVAVVQLWPVADRPWIGGSQHNSELELTFGYNGLGRISGHEVGGVGMPSGPSATLVHGPDGPGFGRLLQEEQIGQIGWLLPTAAVFLIALLVWLWRTPRRDVARASVLGWGLWLLAAAAVLSFMNGIFHPYYTVILGPPVAALVGIGAVVVGSAHRIVGAGDDGGGGRRHRRDGIRRPAELSELPPVAAMGIAGSRRRASGLAGARGRAVDATAGRARPGAGDGAGIGPGGTAGIRGDDGDSPDVRSNTVGGAADVCPPP